MPGRPACLLALATLLALASCTGPSKCRGCPDRLEPARVGTAR